jgi:putative ABC transport system ATP-binding protein
MTAVLELQRVSKRYGSGPAEVHALREVDLSVGGGELVAVMGPSGSGKSTLLTIAGSLEVPSSGEVLVGGAALSGMTRNQRARLRRRAIGYVVQDFNLLAGLTAVENVAMPLELDGVGQKAARASGLAALEELGLADRAGRYPTSCRAVSASGSRSPARWWGSAISCWPTSRPGPWTRSTANRSCACCERPASEGSPAWW